MRARRLSLVLMLLAAAPLFCSPAEEAVRQVLTEQAAAWNLGDIQRFVRTYDEAAVMAGAQPTRGRAAILERYRKRYSGRDQMGTLTFSALEVQMLSGDYASVMGRWHLARSAAAGGEVGGIFTLLVKRTEAGWKIVLDHTS
ncbi:MAG TPA: nuclear transport factor 2 family protein [Bryobacteraceae bacterium]|nr:nuclear transport factor 2 family protein [Bryobacteraceae bacterium]